MMRERRRKRSPKRKLWMPPKTVQHQVSLVVFRKWTWNILPNYWCADIHFRWLMVDYETVGKKRVNFARNIWEEDIYLALFSNARAVWWVIEPPFPLTVSFLKYFIVFFCPYIMIICVLKRNLHQKSHFHPTTRIPNSSFLFAAALSLNGRIVV